MLNHIKKTMVNTTDLTLTCTVCKYSENRFVTTKKIFERFEKDFTKRHEKCGEKNNPNNL